jgi:hypothetical protein
MTTQNNTQTPFGIRVSLPEGDPFARLVDDNWHATHWYPTKTTRDLAMQDMRREHEYSRRGDSPTLIFESIEGSPA